MGLEERLTCRVKITNSNPLRRSQHVNQALTGIDGFRQIQPTSQEFSNFSLAIRNNATPAAEIVFNFVGVDNGKESVATSPHACSWHIHLLVADMPAYLEALEEPMEENSYGNAYMHAKHLELVWSEEI